MKIFKLKKNLNCYLFFSLAFLTRAIYIYRNSWLAGDSYDYLNLAENLALRFTYGFGNTELVYSSAFRPPLYPAFVALFWWTGDALTITLYLQAMIGAITVTLTYLLAEKYFNKRVAFCAAILLSIEPLTIHYTACLMSETLFTFLLVLAVYFFDYEKYFLSGFIFGLATLTRPTILPFLLFILIFPLFSKWSAYRKPFFKIFSITALVVSIWTIRNAIVFEEFIPVSTTGYGYNLLCGTINVPMLADEGWENIKNDPAIQQRTVDLHNGKTESQTDRYLFKEGIKRILINPTEWLKVRLKQYTRLYIDSAPYILGQNNIRFEEALQNRRWFFIFYKVLLVLRIFVFVGLALAGIFILQERLAELSFIVLFPIYLMFIHIPLWTENRYLLPMFPFILMLAAFTLIKCSDFAKNFLKR